MPESSGAFEHPYDPPCDGSSECKALIHLHGCFSDKGHCDAPQEHSSGAIELEADRQYQTERAAILSSAVGRARLHLREGNPGAAQEALDTAALETRQLLERLLPLFDTDRLALPEEAVDGI